MTLAPGLPPCPAALALTADESDRFAELDAWNCRFDVAECRLQDGHQSRHAARVADGRLDNDPGHWLMWDDTGNRELTALPICPAESDTDPDNDFCCLYSGHELAHTWQLAGESAAEILPR